MPLNWLRCCLTGVMYVNLQSVRLLLGSLKELHGRFMRLDVDMGRPRQAFRLPDLVGDMDDERERGGHTASSLEQAVRYAFVHELRKISTLNRAALNFVVRYILQNLWIEKNVNGSHSEKGTAV